MDDNVASAVVVSQNAMYHGTFIDSTDDPNTSAHHSAECREGTGSLAFDGIDDYVQINGHKGIGGAASRTCMAWIKTLGAGRKKAILSWGGR